jgi:hypothetical protein
MGQEEVFVGSGESSVEVEDASLHKSEDHIPVEAVAREHHDRQHNNECQVDSSQPIAFKSIEVVIEFEHVTVPLLGAAVEEQSEWWIGHSVDSLPADDLIPEFGVGLECAFGPLDQQPPNNEYDGVT